MCSARHGGPRTLSRTTDANIDCGFLWKMHSLLNRSVIVKRKQNRIELFSRPGLNDIFTDLFLAAKFQVPERRVQLRDPPVPSVGSRPPIRGQGRKE